VLAADDGRASAERGQQPTGVEHLRVCWVPGAPADVPFITITFANAQRASTVYIRPSSSFGSLFFFFPFCFVFLLFSADRLLFFWSVFSCSRLLGGGRLFCFLDRKKKKKKKTKQFIPLQLVIIINNGEKTIWSALGLPFGLPAHFSSIESNNAKNEV
jgi:hypothetical protein